MKFFIYSRKSVLTDKGESVKNQIELCRKYITAKFEDAQHEITVYEDEGFSAKNVLRPSFQRMMNMLDVQAPDFIVCYRLDRISRNVGDFASLIENLNYRGISFISVSEEFDTSKPMGKAMMYIASVIAQLERETTAERVRDNMRLLAKSGYWLGGNTPIGYTSKQFHEVLIEGKIKKFHQLEMNPDEIGLVTYMFDTMRNSHSISHIVKELAAKNIRSRSGKYFSLLAVRDILTNPVYCTADQDAFDYFSDKKANLCFSDCNTGNGILPYNRRNYTKKSTPRNPVNEWIIAQGRHKGLIPGAAWVEVQNIIEKRRSASYSGPKIIHNDYALLSGLIWCKKCGQRMFAKKHSDRKDKEIFYYICGTKSTKRSAVCDMSNLQGNETDQIVTDYLLNYSNANSGIYKVIEKIKNAYAQSSLSSKRTLEEIEHKISKLQQEFDNMVLALSKSSNLQLIDKINLRSDEISRQLAVLEKEKETETERMQLDKLAENELQLDIIMTTLSALKNNSSSLTISEKQRLIRLLIQKIEWDGKSLDIFIYGE